MVDYSINSESIAVITLNNPSSVNVINRDFIDAYEQAINKVLEEQGLKGVIIASAKKDFMVGGDLQLLLAAKDAQEVIDEIVWTVYGKIDTIRRGLGSPDDDLAFRYDAGGNRIAKVTMPDPSDNSTWATTHYIRDASGNTMAVYREEGGILTLQESVLYGSRRLGLYNRNLDMSAATLSEITRRTLGEKQFEMTNHLRNAISSCLLETQ